MKRSTKINVSTIGTTRISPRSQDTVWCDSSCTDHTAHIIFCSLSSILSVTGAITLRKLFYTRSLPVCIVQLNAAEL